MTFKSSLLRISLAAIVVSLMSPAADALTTDKVEVAAKAESEKSANHSKLSLGMQARRGFTVGEQKEDIKSVAAPLLPGAVNGTTAPQGEATLVKGVNTAGTVRVYNLANMEALMNIIANGMEVIGIAWGGPTMIMACMRLSTGSAHGAKNVVYGAASVTSALATPGMVNWLVASGRDAGFFR